VRRQTAQVLAAFAAWRAMVRQQREACAAGRRMAEARAAMLLRGLFVEWRALLQVGPKRCVPAKSLILQAVIPSEALLPWARHCRRLRCKCEAHQQALARTLPVPLNPSPILTLARTLTLTPTRSIYTDVHINPLMTVPLVRAAGQPD